MSFDGSGNFNRDRSWAVEAAAGTKIRSDHHDTHDTDLANGLSNCITKNGSTTLTADIPWSGKKITNLADPTNPQDAANKRFVENFRTFVTSITISGADANGRITFSSPTGANGLSWTGTDLSFLTRPDELNKTMNRWVFNRTASGATGVDDDVVIIDERGMITGVSGQISQNLSLDNSANWRTIKAGIGSLVEYYSGALKASSNDVATSSAYGIATLREYFKTQNTAGNALLTLNKSASAKTVEIYGNMANKARWLLRLGNAVAENPGADREGSDYELCSYNNAGTVSFREMHINRLTHAVTFGGEVTANYVFHSETDSVILSAKVNGQVLLRPNGNWEPYGQVSITKDGDMHLYGKLTVGEGDPNGSGSQLGAGMQGRVGSSGAFTGHYHNQYWDGTYLRLYANASYIGAMQVVCDYRIKKDVQPLPSTWDAVKRLNPVSYRQKAYDIWVEDDAPRWGFVAHELQEQLLESAATGAKDGADVQSPNLVVIVAALTKALQEAMARIEVLEA